MKILIEPTEHIATVEGVVCRVWAGLTENETECVLFVHRIAVKDSDDLKSFNDLFERLDSEVQVVKR